jgi:hypothetical protein
MIDVFELLTDDEINLLERYRAGRR